MAGVVLLGLGRVAVEVVVLDLVEGESELLVPMVIGGGGGGGVSAPCEVDIVGGAAAPPSAPPTAPASAPPPACSGLGPASSEFLSSAAVAARVGAIVLTGVELSSLP